jgi:hypothetical protein
MKLPNRCAVNRGRQIADRLLVRDISLVYGVYMLVSFGNSDVDIHERKSRREN